MPSARLTILLSIALLSAGTGRLWGQTVPEKTDANIKRLVAVVKSDAGLKEKMDACRQLGVIGDKQAVKPLAALLGDEKLSHMARYALETIPGPEVDEAFRAALKKLIGKPLVGVIGSVGVRRDSKAVPQLALLLKSPEEDIAGTAARSLGKIADRPAVKALKTALSTATPKTQPALAEGLFRCAEALSARGQQKSAAEIYDQLLAAGLSHQIRAGGLRGAILARGQDGVTLLAQHLKGNDPILFLAALKTAQEVPGPKISEILIAELNRPGADRQIAIMQTLGKLKEAAASPLLEKIAQKGEPQTRVEAIQALAEIGASSTVGALFALLVDPDAAVSTAARDALAAFPGSEPDQTLLALVTSGLGQQRLAAMELVLLRRTKSALPALKKAAEDSDPVVRRRAVEAVGKVGEAEDLPFLLARFPAFQAPEDIAVMEAAFADLGIRSSDREAYVAALVGVKGLNAEQQASVLRVLGILGGKNGIAAVRAAVHDQSPEIRDSATRALAAWKTPDAAPDLLEVARAAGDSSNKVVCLRGYLRLASHPDLSPDERMTMASNARPLVTTVEEKRMLLSVLQRNASTSSMSMAAGYLDDPDVREEASLAATAIAEAIVEKHPAEIGPVMEKVLKVTGTKAVADRAKAVLAKAGKVLN